MNQSTKNISSKVPQQEVFLEYETREGERVEISLDSLETMSHETLRGFIQWLVAKIAAMESEKEARMKSRQDSFDSKPLMFKIRIHKFFLNEARIEDRARKDARREWLNSFDRDQKGNTPCNWLGEFGLPKTYSEMKATRKKANEIISGYRRLINVVQKEVGLERAAEIIKDSGITEAGDSDFLVAAAQLKADSRSSVFIAED